MQDMLRCIKAWEFCPRSYKTLNCSQMLKAYCFAYETWEGAKGEGYWFKLRAKQLFSQMEPENKFKFSSGWFDRFKTRNNISFRRTTNIAQKPATDKLSLVRQFHTSIRREAKPSDEAPSFGVGQFKLHQIANMDQTRLPFTFTRRMIRLKRRLCRFMAGLQV